jgi:hypothetical protein
VHSTGAILDFKRTEMIAISRFLHSDLCGVPRRDPQGSDAGFVGVRAGPAAGRLLEISHEDG